MRISLAAVLVSSGLLVSCGSDGEPTGSTCPPDSTLTYASFGQTFIATNCLSCHASRESPRLATLADIQANRGEIDKVAAAGPNAVNTIMPEDGSVDTAERQRLGEWLACGAP
jgi:hypothetical protein